MAQPFNKSDEYLSQIKHAAAKELADSIYQAVLEPMAILASGAGMEMIVTRHCAFPDTEEEHCFMLLPEGNLVVVTVHAVEAQNVTAFFQSIGMEVD